MTSTSSFGVSRREGHDAGDYYARRLRSIAESSDKTVNPLDDSALGLWNRSSEDMSNLPDSSIGFMVTSPPYHVGKDYDTASSFDEYLGMIERVLRETYRVLEPGGRAAINVANLGRKPYVRLSDIVGDIAEGIGFLPRGEIIWIKAEGASGSTAWGTYMSPRNPTLRDVHEYVLVLGKGRWARVRQGQATISAKEFMDSTLSVWRIRPESAKRIGHPAPFPVELAERLINLYSYRDDVVLDPFMGSGTTAVAAEKLGRRWVGYEINQDYFVRAIERIAFEQSRLPGFGGTA